IFGERVPPAESEDGSQKAAANPLSVVFPGGVGLVGALITSRERVPAAGDRMAERRAVRIRRRRGKIVPNPLAEERVDSTIGEEGEATLFDQWHLCCCRSRLQQVRAERETEHDPATHQGAMNSHAITSRHL